MIATKATIPIYAESEEDVRQLERVFYAFVSHKRSQGIAVTATRLIEALNKFQNNPLINNFLR